MLESRLRRPASTATRKSGPTRNCLSRCASSWATGQSLVWTKVHDLPDFAYFSHEIHVNKGIGLRKLPWARGSDAADVCAEHAADGVVPWTVTGTRRRISGPPARFTTWRGKSRRRTGRCGARLAMRRGLADGAERELCDPGSERCGRGGSGVARRCRWAARVE